MPFPHQRSCWLVSLGHGPGEHGRLRAVSGDVRIKVPAAPKYGRMADIAAIHTATYQGFPPDEVADLSQAVKEAVLLLNPEYPNVAAEADRDHEHGEAVLLLDPEYPNGSMKFDFQGKAGIVTVEAQVEQCGSKPIPHHRIDRFEATAGPLVDSWKLDPDKHRLWLQKSAKASAS